MSENNRNITKANVQDYTINKCLAQKGKDLNSSLHKDLVPTKHKLVPAFFFPFSKSNFINQGDIVYVPSTFEVL